MKTNRRAFILSLLIGVFALSLSSCSDVTKPKLEHSFKVAINPEQAVEHFDKVTFNSFHELNLGFFQGDLWLKLDVNNLGRAESFMVINNDLINRNYKFYKLDTLTNKFKISSLIADRSRKDSRTFNFPNPNFRLELNENDKATYLITTYSDGRVLDATPQVIDSTEYGSLINEKRAWSIIFLVVIILLLTINIYQWKVLKRKIYFYYIFYMLATFVMYLGLEGHLHNFGLKHSLIDHFVFISIRVWVFSLLIYTSSFLETKIVAPRFYTFLKTILIVILGGTTLYQFIFYKTSIGNLHFFENILSFVWLLLILTTVLLSAKKRRIELKYYLIPLVCFLFFIMLGLIDGHFQVLPGDPFLYIKTGTVIEFIGFTYFIAHLIKNKISTTVNLEFELAKNRKELTLASEKLEATLEERNSNGAIEKTNFVGIFKLIEQSLSNDSEWDEFKLKFKQLNPDFLERLTKEHSNLSKSDIRLLTLMKLGYSQKETAEILSIEPNSVKKAKSRVRKKLNIPRSEMLSEFIDKY